MKGEWPRARHRLWLSVLIGVLLALALDAVYWWPDAEARICLVAMGLVATLYLVLKQPWGPPALLWVVAVAAAGFGCLALVLGLTPYGFALLMVGVAQVVAVLCFWPRRAFRQPRITREMLEPARRVGGRAGREDTPCSSSR
jgi:hypothetical protein